MKKTIIALLFVFAGFTNAFSQKSMQAIFDRYDNDDRFTYVSVGKGAFNLVRSFVVISDLSSEEMNIITKMNGVKILTLELTKKNDSTAKSIVGDVNKLIKTGKYETIAEVRDKGERTQIYVADDKSEMIIVNMDSSELSLIWLQGSRR